MSEQYTCTICLSGDGESNQWWHCCDTPPTYSSGRRRSVRITVFILGYFQFLVTGNKNRVSLYYKINRHQWREIKTGENSPRGPYMVKSDILCIYTGRQAEKLSTSTTWTLYDTNYLLISQQKSIGQWTRIVTHKSSTNDCPSVSTSRG